MQRRPSHDGLIQHVHASVPVFKHPSIHFRLRCLARTLPALSMLLSRSSFVSSSFMLTGAARRLLLMSTAPGWPAAAIPTK